MATSIGAAYKLKCTCGHEIIQHIGNKESFACNVREEECICKFFRSA